MIPKLMFFPLAHITFLIKMKKNLNSEIGKTVYITLEMCLLTRSEKEVHLTIKLNAVQS